MYKWFLVGRYLRTKLIAFFAICAVTLCVAMMLVVLSVMGGFLDMVKERSRGLLSDIIVDNGSLQGFPYYEEFIAHLHQQAPDVVRDATPVVQNYGMLRSPRNFYTKPVRIVGIRLDEYGKVNTFDEGLFFNGYYPGTTNLGEQQQPLAGAGEAGRFDRLPPEYEEANRRWRESNPDREELEKYLKQPFVVLRGAGERVFASPMDLEGWSDLSKEPDLTPRYVGDPHRGIIIGVDVLHERQQDGTYLRYFKKGELLTLTALPISEKGSVGAGLDARTELVRYADDSRTGVFEIDEICVYVDFDWIQKLLDMHRFEYEDGTFQHARASQILIRLQPGVSDNEGRRRLTDLWNEFRARLALEPGSPEAEMLTYVKIQTWEDMQARFIAAVEKEKNLVTVLFGVVMLVAVVLVGLVFWMIVEKKTKDIGILKSMGASSEGIAGIFVTYAVAIGLLGAVLGSSLGGVFVFYINEIQDWLASINPSLRVWSPDVYTFDRIPNVVKQADVIWISIGAIFASILGALIPAIHASAVWPVKALRYE